MELFPSSVSGWLRYGHTASFTAGIAYLFLAAALSDFRTQTYLSPRTLGQAGWTVLTLLVVFSIARFRRNRPLAICGLILALVVFLALPLVTAPFG